MDRQVGDPIGFRCDRIKQHNTTQLKPEGYSSLEENPMWPVKGLTRKKSDFDIKPTWNVCNIESVK